MHERCEALQEVLYAERAGISECSGRQRGQLSSRASTVHEIDEHGFGRSQCRETCAVTMPHDVRALTVQLQLKTGSQ